MVFSQYSEEKVDIATQSLMPPKPSGLESIIFSFWEEMQYLCLRCTDLPYLNKPRVIGIFKGRITKPSIFERI